MSNLYIALKFKENVTVYKNFTYIHSEQTHIAHCREHIG